MKGRLFVARCLLSNLIPIACSHVPQSYDIFLKVRSKWRLLFTVFPVPAENAGFVRQSLFAGLSGMRTASVGGSRNAPDCQKLF